MFTRRELSGEVAAVRDEHGPAVLVLDCERDFETLSPAVAENLALVTDQLEPRSYPAEWLPADAPDVLARLASDEFTIGTPEDGGVAWTRQTIPPVVLVKPRLDGSPDAFVDFLLANALVEVGLDVPEHFLGFFADRYPEFAAATRDALSPVETYQLAAALYDAYLGLHTRQAFLEWAHRRPELYDAYLDAGERLQPRLDGLSREVATGATGFSEAAELACAAIKHAVPSDARQLPDERRTVEIPTPFGALDNAAYRQHGADYAIEWAEKTLAELSDA